MSEVPAYIVTRSHRKTLSIYLERDGTISVLAPENLTDDEIHIIVARKNFQIYKHLAERDELNATRSLREIVSGETFPYLGRNYRLQLVDDQPTPLLLKEGYFCLKREDKEKAQEFLRSSTGRRHTANQQASLIFQRPDGRRNRSGSCDGSAASLGFLLDGHGRSELSLEMLMAPLSVLDYIIVHEMAHLKFDNHSEAFWNEVDKVMPDYRDRKQWLRFNGAGMDL